MMMRLTSKGFSVVVILLIIVIVTALGVGGWTVYHHEHKSVATKPVTKVSKI